MTLPTPLPWQPPSPDYRLWISDEQARIDLADAETAQRLKVELNTYRSYKNGKRAIRLEVGTNLGGLFAVPDSAKVGEWLHQASQPDARKQLPPLGRTRQALLAAQASKIVAQLIDALRPEMETLLRRCPVPTVDELLAAFQPQIDRIFWASAESNSQMTAGELAAWRHTMLAAIRRLFEESYHHPPDAAPDVERLLGEFAESHVRAARRIREEARAEQQAVERARLRHRAFAGRWMFGVGVFLNMSLIYSGVWIPGPPDSSTSMLLETLVTNIFCWIGILRLTWCGTKRLIGYWELDLAWPQAAGRALTIWVACVLVLPPLMYWNMARINAEESRPPTSAIVQSLPPR